MIMSFYNAPTFNIDTQKWDSTSFDTRRETINYIESKFKYPGEYNLKHTQGIWNEQATIFNENERVTGNGHYPKFSKGTVDHKKHWDFEKEKCSFEGFIIYKKPSEGLEYCVPGLYYWYLNYCPIPDKVKQKDDFPDIYDGDLHYYLYILKCILRRRYGVVLKKRQCLLGDTVIQTEEGFKRIDKLENSDYKGIIYSYDPVTNEKIQDTVLKVRKGKITNKYLKILTASGKFVECSLDHKIFTKRGWIEAKDLLLKDELTLDNEKFGNVIITNEEAIVIGYFITDGSYAIKNSSPKFTNNNSYYLKDFYNNLIKLSPESDICKLKKGNGFDYCIVSKDRNKGTKNEFKRWLYNSGFCAKWENRQLPNKYMNLQKEQTSLLLNRMFASNGWIHKIKTKQYSCRYEIGIASMSSEMIQQIQTLLYRYGINSNINKETDTFYKLRIFKSKDVNIFIKDIGIFKKDENLAISKIVVNKSNFIGAKIKKIINIQKKVQLYDIETIERNSFFANGIYVHNSGYSLKNMSIMLNAIWFGKSAIAKIFAADISKVQDSWSFMTKYRDHNNVHCAWKRGFDPTRVLDWQIRRKQSDGTYKGNNSIAKGFTTKQNATNGIGGSAKVIFGEEAGANPTLDKTHEFITSNVSLGGLVTGLIIYSGAVGELEHADPLKEFITHPEDHDFLGCDNNIEDDIEFGEKVGFFAPEWWNYVSVERDEDDNPIGEAMKCFDQDGNSNKIVALSEIKKWRKKAEAKSPEGYRYYTSQRPLSIKEAFTFRKESRFPQNLIQAQKRRIEDKQYFTEYVDIERDEQGVLKFVKTNKFPIKDFPVSKTDVDKEGCIVIYERPAGYPLKPELSKFYAASIDPVKTGKTRTSLSLFSIIIYKLDVEVLKLGGELESWIEPGKIVAEWTGRFDDINKTHLRAEQMLEIYGAQAICEANVYQFVNYMIGRKRQHYLVPKTHMLFLKEFGSNEQAFQEYGWQNTGKIFENNLLPSAVDFLKEEIGDIKGTDGEIHKIIYGVERIPSLMILKEMEMYQVGMNVDRLIAFAALCAYIKILLANRGYSKKIIETDKKTVDKNLYTKPSSFFKTNKQSSDSKYNVKKSMFRHIK